MEKNLKDDVNIKFGNDVVKLDVNISILFRLEGKLDWFKSIFFCYLSLFENLLLDKC